VIDQQQPDFDGRNPVLWLGLGVLGAGRRLDALLDRPDGTGPRVAPDDPVLLAVLGLISLRRTVRRHLAAGSETPEHPPASAERPLDRSSPLR